MPVVEDPGSFAVRGSLLDVWPPGARRAGARRALRRRRPLDQVVRPDDADARARDATLKELWLAAGARRDPHEGVRRARADARRAARRRDRLADDEDARARRRRRHRARLLRRRRLTCPRTTTSSRRSPRTSRTTRASCSTDPAAITRAVRDELGRADAGRRAKAQRAAVPARRRSTEPRTTSLRDLARAPRRRAPRSRGRRRGRGPRARYEVDAATRSISPRSTTTDLDARREGARASTKGRTGALAPVARAHRALQGPRPARLPRRARADAGGAARGAPPAPGHRAAACAAARSIRRGSTSRGARPARTTRRADRRRPARARRRRSRPRASRSSPRRRSSAARAHRAPRAQVAARQRARRSSRTCARLSVGDYVVHVEHGIGRYLGLVHKRRRRAHRRSARRRVRGGRQALPPRLPPQPDPEVRGRRGRRAEARPARRRRRSRRRRRASRRPSGRWPTSCSASTPSARRSPGDALEPADDDYRAFEATFPFDETRRSGARHRRRERGPRDAAPDGPPRLRRRRLRQDRGRDPRGVPRRDGGQAGRACSARPRCSRSSTSARFEARMADYPITRARALALPDARRSRTRRSRGLKDGKVDVVIGTHRLLSKDIHFKQPRPARRRRGAALRRHAQGAHQAAPHASRRAHALRHADPAHAADGGERPARPLAHHHAAGRSPRRPHRS